MNRRQAAICLVAGFLSSGAAFARDEGGTEEESSLDLRELEKQVSRLVKKYYPKAKVELKNSIIRFEYDARDFQIHTPDLGGRWQDAHEERGPQPGGLYGELEPISGPYTGMAGVPQVFDNLYFKTHLMAPYSKKLDHHLWTNLKVPRQLEDVPRTPAKFIEDFKKLVDGFDKYATKKRPAGKGGER